jgi:pilus assembly protein Flp/PilA
MNVVTQVLRNERGATMVEYSIMIALIAAVCFVAVAALGTTVHGLFNTTSSTLTSAL